MKFSEAVKIIEECPDKDRGFYKNKPMITSDGKDYLLLSTSDFGLSVVDRKGENYHITPEQVKSDEWTINEEEEWATERMRVREAI